MDLRDFTDIHLPALEQDEIRHNVLIAVISGAAANPSEVLFWSLGAPGHCAVKYPGRSIILGALSDVECEALAVQTRDLDYEGVVGVDDVPARFVKYAEKLGARFADMIPKCIHVIDGKPNNKAVEGVARLARPDEAPLLFSWVQAFREEAVPHDPPPKYEFVEKAIAAQRYLLWTVDGEPVSLAGVIRRLKTSAAIAPVFTPRDLRGRGYAGAATAAIVQHLYAEGKERVCLYTDLRNAASNKCYANVGFRPYCDAWHYLREPF